MLKRFRPLYLCRSRVWIYPGNGGWHFVTLPKKDSDDIKMFRSPIRRGFGSIRVSVKIGETEWETSVFPDKETQRYILPLKREVRNKEGLKADQLISYQIKIIPS